jgi:hypothetical protein
MSDKCGAECRPTSCFYKGRRLVASLEGGGFYGTELHFPCGDAGCKAAQLCREEDLKHPFKPVVKPPQPTGDADLDKLEAELRARLRAQGLNY